MIRFSTTLLILGTLVPQWSLAAQVGDELPQKCPVTQTTAPDAAMNSQTLQTLTDIRDSQLSVLQAQVEILSILQSQAKPPVTASSHDTAPMPGPHATKKKRHEPRSSVNLSAVR
jgi:hypothetical protein